MQSTLQEVDAYIHAYTHVSTHAGAHVRTHACVPAYLDVVSPFSRPSAITIWAITIYRGRPTAAAVSRSLVPARRGAWPAACAGMCADMYADMHTGVCADVCTVGLWRQHTTYR